MSSPYTPDTTGPDADSAVIARCEDVTREYARDGGGWRQSNAGPTVTALAGVDLAVRSGEILGIEGPSGSGKSTLLHLVAALDTPTRGRVVVDGHEVSALGERERARVRLSTVGIVFQRFHLLPALSARANVALPLVERGVGKRERRERAEELLGRVGLADRATHRPSQLSGGEQQRVALARALATDPPLVVADEPTGELDTETGDTVLDLLSTLADDDRAVVVASHDDRTLARADRRIALRDGRRVDA